MRGMVWDDGEREYGSSKIKKINKNFIKCIKYYSLKQSGEETCHKLCPLWGIQPPSLSPQVNTQNF